MTCTYTLKYKNKLGKEKQIIFSSELALDDFLLTSHKYKSTFGDIVFDLEAHPAQQLSTLDTLNHAQEEAEEIFKKGVEYEITEDGRSIVAKRPYIGVNSYLGAFTFTDEAGDSHHLYPIFQQENYWENRFQKWKTGEWSDSELEVFFQSLDEIDNAKNGLTDDPNFKNGLSRFEYYRVLMEEKWEAQCLSGDAVHSVFQLYFSKVKDVLNEALYTGKGISPDTYIKDVISDPIIELAVRDALSKETYKKKDGHSYVRFNELMSVDLVTQTFSLCKVLAQKLESDTMYGSGCEFYPEFKISGKVSKATPDGCNTVIGIIDLLVVDSNGVPHIIDYKTSLKEYRKFDSAKKRGFTYLVAMYGRLLALKGLKMNTFNDYNILPIQLTNFVKDASGRWGFEKVAFKLGGNIFESLDREIFSFDSPYIEHLDLFIEVPISFNVLPQNLLENTLKTEQLWFPGYTLFRHYEEKDVVTMMKKDGVKQNSETGLWEWRPSGRSKAITAKSEAELVKKAVESFNDDPKRRERLVAQVKNALKKGISTGDLEGSLPKHMESNELDSEWLKRLLKHYCNENWKVLDDPRFENLESLGVIVLENLNPGCKGLLDFIKISTRNFYQECNFGHNRHNLAGAFKTDLYYTSRLNDIMLSAALGNVEMMEVMIALNQMPNLFGNQAIVGKILLMDPYHLQGMSASNKELSYCFNELWKLKNPENQTNNFASGLIKMASAAQIARSEFTDVMRLAHKHNYGQEYRKFENCVSCLSALDTAIEQGTVEEQIKALEDIRHYLERNSDGSLDNISKDSSASSQEHVRVYNMVLLAIADLKGISFRQQLSDHSKWGDSVIKSLKDGLHGTYLDNPGNMKSETLNLLTKLITEAYLNVRLDMQDPAARLRKLTIELKKKKGFGWGTEVTIGNEADLFRNLYRENTDGDLVFKNPWVDKTLSPIEKEYLIECLRIINRDRMGLDILTGQLTKSSSNARSTLTMSEFNEFKLSNSISSEKAYDFFKAPLAKGDSSAFSSLKGLLNALVDRLKGWTPKEVLKRAKEAAEGVADKIYSADEIRQERSRENLFEMTNMFEKGIDSEYNRKEFIAKRGGTAYFESNLETLTLKHAFAYSMKSRVDDVMPTIKAALIHLTLQGEQLNDTIGFKNDIEYAENYIKNKIKNESIVDELNKQAEAFIGKFRSLASKMTLMFSPVQALGQTIQGIWNDISLVVRKPDGTEAFTAKNMLTAAKLVYKNLFHFGDDPTVEKLLNEVYGINDMDMNTYVDKIKSDLWGFHNFTNLLFLFASRPDFYNRMTIIVAKMLHDGTYEAHSVDPETKQLVYDWTKDKRFSLLNNPRANKNSKEYLEQQALYYTIARLFEKEKTSYPNGELFTVDMNEFKPLPRAYTNMEAESMKSLTDTIYGYYSHEKKAMVLSTLIGGMWMQFRTYWSGKKNQYLAGGGVRLEGQWKPYTEIDENGVEHAYYYQVDPDGTVRYDLPPTENVTSAPVVRWEGNWKEGILQTLGTLISNIKQDGFLKGFLDVWECEDPNLRNTYKSNIKLLTFDLSMMAFIGPLLTAALAGLMGDKDDYDKTAVDDGLQLAAWNVLNKSLQYSYMDFNFINTISEPATSWTPFSFSYYRSLLLRTWSTALNENKSNWDIVINSTAAGRVTKPFWDTLKPEKEIH